MIHERYSDEIVLHIGEEVEVLYMKDLDNLSESEIERHSGRTDVRLVSSTTEPSSSSIQRPLDESDIEYLQQSRLTNIQDEETYTIVPEENLAFFTVTVQEKDLERSVNMQKQNNDFLDDFPDDVLPEIVLSREASWIARTINNGQHLIHHVRRVDPDNYYIEVKPQDTEVVMNFVFDG